MKNITFSFETSPNINPKRKKWGDMAYYVPPSKKVGRTHPPCSPPNCAHACDRRWKPRRLIHGLVKLL